VGYIGDGINDTPSMKVADVSISVMNAVDIAKESADIILLQNDLKVIAEGVTEGRKTFGNTMKYIQMAMSSTRQYVQRSRGFSVPALSAHAAYTDIVKQPALFFCPVILA